MPPIAKMTKHEMAAALKKEQDDLSKIGSVTLYDPEAKMMFMTLSNIANLCLGLLDCISEDCPYGEPCFEMKER